MLCISAKKVSLKIKNIKRLKQRVAQIWNPREVSKQIVTFRIRKKKLEKKNH